jgi:hypothetical protein
LAREAGRAMLAQGPANGGRAVNQALPAVSEEDYK